MRRGFTLMEMLVVMAIAMILMGMIASAWGKIKQGQDLANGASTVQSALQTARAQAMQLNKVLHVYFLDGGSWNKNFRLDSTGAPVVETADTYLRAYTTYEVPYELLLVSSDGEEISREQLPNGVAWLSLGRGAGPDIAGGNVYSLAGTDFDTIGIKRNCSLVISFSPTGNAWHTAASARDFDSAIYEDTRKYLRIFMLDDISTPTPTASASTLAPILTDFWREDGKIKNKSADATKLSWRTVVMNYTTGLVDMIDGKDEPQ